MSISRCLNMYLDKYSVSDPSMYVNITSNSRGNCVLYSNELFFDIYSYDSDGNRVYMDLNRGHELLYVNTIQIVNNMMVINDTKGHQIEYRFLLFPNVKKLCIVLSPIFVYVAYKLK